MSRKTSIPPSRLIAALNLSKSTWKDIKELYGITQKQAYDRLYKKGFNFISQYSAEEVQKLRRFYKEICVNSDCKYTPVEYRELSHKQYNLKKGKEEREQVIEYDATEDESFERRNIGEVTRDTCGKIIGYKFKILVRDSDPLEGTLSLEQMQNLHFLYSNQGKNLPTNKVLESFPQYTINELKKIIRAFNLTKCSEPFAPHFIESHTEEELKTFRIRYKGERSANLAIRDEAKGLTEYIKDQAKQIKELQDKEKFYSDLFSSLKLPVIESRTLEGCISERTLILYPSDMHIGCYINKRSTFYHPYDLEEIKSRIEKVISGFVDLEFDKIIIANLGDSIDGFNNQTTRGGHFLPQIPEGNKEIYRWFIDSMLYMFELIHKNLRFNELRYYSVGESNHGGDIEYICQKSLENLINRLYPHVTTEIFEEAYGAFKVYNQNFIITHGKDSYQMFKNLPLTIHKNPDIENRINQLLDRKFGFKTANIIKGDLHQSSTSYGDRFRYRSVGCMLGSSEWTGANFGDNDAYLDYDIVSVKGDILEGHLKLS